MRNATLSVSAYMLGSGLAPAAHSPFSRDLMQVNKNMALLRGHTRVHILAILTTLLAFEYKFYDFYG